MRRFAFVLLLVVVAGCTPARYRHHEPIVDSRWVLVEANFWQSESGRLPEATLEFRGNNFAAYSGCNRASGMFRAIDNRWIETGPLATTHMACAGALNRFEQRYFAILDANPSFVATGDRLTLSSVTDVMTFQLVPPTPR